MTTPDLCFLPAIGAGVSVARRTGVHPQTGQRTWDMVAAKDVEPGDIIWTDCGDIAVRQVYHYELARLLGLPNPDAPHCDDGHKVCWLSPSAVVFVPAKGVRRRPTRVDELHTTDRLIAAVEREPGTGQCISRFSMPMRAEVAAAHAVAFDLPGGAAFYAAGVLVRTPT